MKFELPPMDLLHCKRPQERLPDVVLVDIGLPGMDGYEVAMKIGEQPKEKRPLFIAVTGFGSEGYYRLAKNATIDVHLLKPVDPEQLKNVLKRFQAVISKRDSCAIW